MSRLGTLRRREQPSAPHPADATAPEIAVAAASVNLLSPWVLQQLRVRSLRKRLGYALFALVLLVAGSWTGQQLRVAEARAELRGERAVGSSLSARIQDLEPVESYVGAVRTRARAVQSTMYTEIEFSRVLTALNAALPPRTRLEGVSLSLPAPAGVPAAAGSPSTELSAPATDTGTTAQSGPGRGISAACPGPDPFATLTIVGCVVFSGTAPNRATVAELVHRLDRERLFVEPFVATTTINENAPLSFSGSVGLSPIVFSGRYDGLVDELLAALADKSPDPERAPSDAGGSR